MSPADVERCSLWSFAMAVEGYVVSKNGGARSVEPPTPEEFDKWVSENE